MDSASTSLSWETQWEPGKQNDTCEEAQSSPLQGPAGEALRLHTGSHICSSPNPNPVQRASNCKAAPKSLPLQV